ADRDARRRRGRRRPDRRAAGAAHRQRRADRRYSADRRHLRSDPLRIPGRHLPAGREHPAGRTRSAHHRCRDRPRSAAHGVVSPHAQGAPPVATGRSRNRPNVVRLLPSVITILAFSAGLSAVKFALDGQLGTALGMIGAAAVLDSLDGRIARMLDATSKIGAELDSLSDAVAFGVAPALVLYVTMLDGSPFGWIVALLYAVSLVLRLARFNTLLEDDSVPAYAREYFVGVPAPAAAL